jgi:mannose-6-phosphate isomerase-like protein (cupin superfamily)
MTVRRVVTGADSTGRSCVTRDGPPAVGFTLGPGADADVVWEVGAGDPPEDCDRLPAPGVARVLRRIVPAGAGCPDARLHRTETLDVVYVAEGALELVLETGTVALAAGDFVVDRGDVHGWRNPHDTDAVLVAVMVGTSLTNGEHA